LPINELVGWSTIKNIFNHTGGFRILEEAVAIDTLHLIISKLHRDGLILQYKFDKAFQELEDDGTIDRIVKEHLRAIHEPGERMKIKLVTGNEYAPFTDQKLPNRGMITEIMEKVFEKLGLQSDIGFLGWKDGYDKTKNGQFDGTFPYVRTPERMADYHYSRPLFEILTRWFVKKDANIKGGKPEDLRGLVCCKSEGYNLSDIQTYLDRKLIRLENPWPKNLGDCFKLLKQGKVDLVPINELVGFKTINDIYGSPQDFRMLEEAVAIDTLHFIVPKSRKDARALVRKFDRVLDEIENDGTLDEIVKRHLKRHYGSN